MDSYPEMVVHGGALEIELSESSDLVLFQESPSPSTTSTRDDAEKKRSFALNQRSQTKMALLLSLATVCLLVIVTVSVHITAYYTGRTTTSSSGGHRYLDQNNNDDAYIDDAASAYDYYSYTCDDIFTQTESGTAAQCSFAQTCNSGSGLFASFIFCQQSNGNESFFNFSWKVWVGLLSPLLTIWLVILFRMLGSTAEEFFSPSLEMFSLKMGLPPRFAGVTLLALGNGAADVSATISAIVQNPEEGYDMSLGALTGAGMFVGTVVAGMVIVSAGGVKCRGALVRDVLMLMVTVTVVYVFFEKGVMGNAAIRTFILLYFVFVAVVLAADVYHRKVVLPRIQRINQEEAAEAVAASASALDEGALSSIPEAAGGGLDPQNDGTVGDVELTNAASASPTAARPNGLARPSRKKSTKRGFTDKVMILLSNYEKDEGKASTTKSFKGWGSKWNITSQEIDRPVRLHGQHGILHKNSTADDDGSVESDAEEPASAYSALLDEMDTMCGVVGVGAVSTGSYDSNRPQIVSSNLRTVPIQEQMRSSVDEFFGHFRDLIKDIFHNEENKALDKFFLVLELPFTILRKLTVPIPCEGYYCRTLVALSCAFVPLWVASYALIERHTNLFYTGDGYPNFAISMLIAGSLGYMFLIFAPSDAKDVSLKIRVPIALVGFLMAALWIDTIADQLVKLLTFLGVICRIPNSIMGLTVLAWGNSMGDLSANMTMAKKGLANMAITACFAGPVFNILVGLGGGFLQLNSLSGVDETNVNLSLPNAIGFAFIMVNCLLVLVYGLLISRGTLSTQFGYVAVGLYVVYVVTCVVLQIYVG